jgi:hypothetical protein
LTCGPNSVTIADAVSGRRLETVQVVVLCVLVGVAGGTFATHRFGGLFWAVGSLAAVWLVSWLVMRLVFLLPISSWRQVRGSRD